MIASAPTRTGPGPLGVFMTVLHQSRVILGFGIWVLGSIFLIAWLPLIFIASGCQIWRMQRSVRRIVRHFFAFVMWYVRLLGVIDVKTVWHDQGSTAPILIGNHISMFDVLSSLALFPECITFVKVRYWLIPIVYPIVKSCGFIVVDPSRLGSRQRAFEQAKNQIKKGLKLIVFPEGTRTKDGKLGHFSLGAFRLAMELQVPITPLVFTSSSPIFGKTAPSEISLRAVSYRMHVMTKIPCPSPPLSRSAVLSFRDQVAEQFDQFQHEPWIFPWHRLQHHN